MNLKEAMQKRHMVRKYINKPISDELINKINERESKIKEAMNGDTYSKENGSEFLSEGFKVNSHSIERNGNIVIVTLDAYKSLSKYFKKDEESKSITEYSKGYTQMGFVCVE